MTPTDDVLRFAAALRRMARHTENLPRLNGSRLSTSPPETLNPAAYFETHFDVACVALPGLCLNAAARYLALHGDSLPPGLQAMADAAGPGAGRPVRGMCIACRGKGLLLTDEADSAEEQRFSLPHEGSHFLLDHFLPREEVLRKFGPSVRDVLDGRRPPNWAERFDATLRGVPLVWHSHLYERDSPHRTDAEDDADALACLLLLPPPESPDNLPPPEAAEPLAQNFSLPVAVVGNYLAALRHNAEAQKPPPPHPLLRRFGIS